MANPDNLKDVGVRLFLSVDIAGSTKFKASRPSIKIDDSATEIFSPEASWVQVFENFFSDFPNRFNNNLLKELSNKTHFTKGLENHLRLWKMLGDELIFVVPIKTEADAGYTLIAFEQTITDYQKTIKSKHPELKLKGVAWTAGFPIRNRRVSVRQADGGQVDDYIGPDMDIGFRLGKLARPGPIIASMDLIDILIGRSYRLIPFNCVFVGWETLKGVFADKPYPVHWLVNNKRQLDLPPWEESICRFAKSYLDNVHSGEKTDQTKDRIEKIREALNNEDKLELFSPYLDPADMPDSHKKIHEWLAENARSEVNSAADFGQDRISSKKQKAKKTSPRK